MTPKSKPQDRMALDRASVRTIDPNNGHLHVRVANLSAARTSPYRGSEVPNWRELGLDPDRIYQLHRPAEELAKSVAGWNGKPLLDLHRQQSASTHDRDLVVGTVSNVRWNPPFLQGELAVWDGIAIAGIESGEQKELSCGYYYRAEMIPGVHNGIRYDGSMKDIRADHIALVDRGRLGSDVAVGDAALKIIRKIAMDTSPENLQAVLVKLVAFLQDKMPDPALDEISVLLDGGTDENGASTGAMDRMLRARVTKARATTDAKTLQRRAELFPNANRFR